MPASLPPSPTATLGRSSSQLRVQRSHAGLVAAVPHGHAGEVQLEELVQRGGGDDLAVDVAALVAGVAPRAFDEGQGVRTGELHDLLEASP
jgi:hypothetical protein